MELTIYNEREQTRKEITFSGTTVEGLLKQLSINQETVLIVRNSEVITENEMLNDKDKLEILSIISGG